MGGSDSREGDQSPNPQPPPKKKKKGKRKSRRIYSCYAREERVLFYVRVGFVIMILSFFHGRYTYKRNDEMCLLIFGSFLILARWTFAYTFSQNM